MPRSCCSGAVRATVDRGVHAKSLARPAIRTVVVLFSCVVTNREPEKICFVWGDETLTFRLCFLSMSSDRRKEMLFWGILTVGLLTYLIGLALLFE